MTLGSDTPTDGARNRRKRTLAVAAGALTLLVAGTPFLPDNSGPTPSIAPAGDTTPAAPESTEPGRVTSAMRAEIERVVAEGEQLPVSARSSAYRLATAATRCATFDGQRYCLGLGWTMKTQEEAATRLAATAARVPSGKRPEQTGDLDPVAAIRQRARLSPQARATLERKELTAAARSVAKVWQIRHDIQGIERPDARDDVTTPTPVATETITPTVTPVTYPERFTVLKAKQVRPQKLTYYCGPTTMQMIGWGWEGVSRSQTYWADQLNTTSAGTAITDMVRVVNEQTGYDDPEHAGEYIVLDISDFTFDQWWTLMMRHIHDYTAPVVLHPVLQKQYYPYLDDDASGHFQVGRGFDQNAGQPLLGYFEPWDQSRFDPTEPRIARNQWQSAYKSYRANQAHFQHNVGV